MTRPLPLVAWREDARKRLRIERPSVTASVAEKDGKRYVDSSDRVCVARSALEGVECEYRPLNMRVFEVLFAYDAGQDCEHGEVNNGRLSGA